MPRVLLVEDEDLDAGLIEAAIPKRFETIRVETLKAARNAISDQPMDLVLLDYLLPDGNGIELLADISRLDPELPVIFVTAVNDAPTGIAALRSGAREFVVKDRSYLEALPIVIENVLRNSDLQTRNDAMRLQLRRHKDELAIHRRQASAASTPRIVGGSAATQRLLRSIRQAARSTETVLIYGETGTGKELVARAIHDGSERRAGGFVAVNCAAIPESLVEAELFGFTKGSFTGADRERKGYLAAAAEGALFLDEIGELPASTQAKLLRVLQEREYLPIGTNGAVSFTGRVVAASNVNLEDACERGTFRRDLFYRLHVIRIVVPPLRDRREDISELVRHFTACYNARNNTTFDGFSVEAIHRMEKAPWPGNVRELENFITRVLAATEPGAGDVEIPSIVAKELSLQADDEVGMLLAALERHRWNRQEAAAELGISRTTLWRKMVKYNLWSH